MDIEAYKAFATLYGLDKSDRKYLKNYRQQGYRVLAGGDTLWMLDGRKEVCRITIPFHFPGIGMIGEGTDMHETLMNDLDDLEARNTADPYVRVSWLYLVLPQDDPDDDEYIWVTFETRLLPMLQAA